jgi:hypothetical protein
MKAPSVRAVRCAIYTPVLRYLLPPRGKWLVGAPDQFVPYLLEQSFHALRLDGLEGDPPPNTLEAPTTEATKHAVPIPERLPVDRARESPYARSKARLPRTFGCRAPSSLSGQAGL